jgi:hypothetical protein
LQPSSLWEIVKRTFIYFLVGFLAIATVAYFVYLLIDAIRGMYKDWRLAREMDELEAWSRQKKASDADAQSRPQK